MDMRAEARRPEDCTEVELEAFCRLVRDGGEVEVAHLGEAVRSAHRLILVFNPDVVGCCGLKHPRRAYRDYVARASGVRLEEELFPIELGWLYFAREHRGQGGVELGLPLVEREIRRLGCFATVRTSNHPTARILRLLGFELAGRPYPSRRGEELRLWLRAPSTA
jgi:hypothetical protein